MADVFRSVLLALIAANAFFAVTVMATYLKRVAGTEHLRSPLTRHVVVSATGFVLLLAYAFAEIAMQLGTEITWQTIYLIPVFVLWTVNQYFMFDMQARKWRRHE